MYEYNAKIVNVVDGDTFDLNIDLGFHIHLHERVRVLDLDTPEKRGDAERELGQIVSELAVACFLGKACVIHSKKELSPTTDSFGRWLVEVVMSEGAYAGRSVTEVLTELGVNKLDEGYSEEKVRELEGRLSDLE